MQTLFGPPPKRGLFERLQDRISGAMEKTRDGLRARVDELVQRHPTVGPELIAELETALVAADLGPRTAADIMGRVRADLIASSATGAIPAEAVRAALRAELIALLTANQPAPRVTDAAPLVVMLVGVNGTGKTTTVGKLAHYYRSRDLSVLICAGDTFRAAATDQVQVWAERAGVELVRQQPGADPSAVLYDALSAARSRGIDCVLVDTAGRLHTKTNLMQELSKMRRTADRLIPGAPQETLLVLDATTGQNGLQQARQFTAATPLTGLIVTKLDGTARGGIVVAIARELNLPVRFVGVGEQAADLLPFDAAAYVDGLLGAPA